MSNQWTSDLALSSDATANVAEPTFPEVKPVESTPAKRRASLCRWLIPRFSLRTMLLLMTAICLVLGSGILRAERQRVACEKLTENRWSWSFEQPDDDSDPFGKDDELDENEPWWLRSFPEKWRRSHGVHYWRSVERAYDGDTKAPEMFAAIAQLPALRELIISHGEHPGDRAIWPIVGRLRTLRKLVLNQTTIDDEGMTHLGRLTGLTHLDLDETIVGDEGVKQLARLTSLEYLSLNDTNVTDESMPYLVALPRLKWVDLSNTRVTPLAINALLHRPNPVKFVTDSRLLGWHEFELEWLESDSAPFTDDDLETRSSKSGVSKRPYASQGYFKDLRVDAGEALTPEQIEILSRVRYVERLTLRGQGIGDKELKYLSRSHAISEWCFDQTSLSHEGFKWLGMRSTLSELAVIGSPVAAQDIVGLGNFQNLRALTLRDTALDKETLRAVLSMPGLRDLELLNCPLPEDAAEEFARSKNRLTRLALDSRTLSPESFCRHWPGFSFETLVWDGVVVDDCVLQWLKGQTAEPHSALLEESSPRGRCSWRNPVDHVCYCGLDFPYRQTQALRSQFVEEPHILKVLSIWSSGRGFNFSGTKIGSRAMDALASNVYLQKLALAKTSISDRDLRHAGNWTQLSELDLSGCSITDAGASALSACWRLENLWLDKTGVGDESMQTIAKMERLTVLSLRETKVTDAGLLSLHDLEHLGKLRLGGTQVTADAVAKFQRRHPECQVDLVEPEVYDSPLFLDRY